jgi:MGT family glycosyltransferase
MSRVLFLSHATVGHLNTLLSIALHMREDGHEVSFLIPGDRRFSRTGIALLDTAFSLPALIERNGMPVEVMRPPLSMLLPALLLPFTQGYRELQVAARFFTAGLGTVVSAILQHARRLPPDVLVSDFAFAGASIAADVLRIPYAMVYHSGLPFRGEGIPPMGSGLPIGPNAGVDPAVYEAIARKEARLIQHTDQRVMAARRSFGLDDGVADFMRRPYSPWLNLVTSVEAIEAPRDNLSANTLYVGPCFSKRKAMQTEFPYDDLRPDRCKVYVSLGTVFNNKPQVFRRILDGLDHPDFQVIVSAGGAYDRIIRQRIPANAMIFRSVPQVDLLPRVDMVIGHGGNNSTNETLAAGKPLIVLPVGGEQGDNARRVEYLGCGSRLDINQFSASDIRQVVDHIRSTPGYAARAAALSAAIAQADGPRTAAACVAWIAEQRRPLARPSHLPLTITQATLGELLRG